MKKQNVYAAGLWGAALSLALLAGALGCNNGAASTYTPPETGALNDPAKRRPVSDASLAHPIKVIEFRKGLTQYTNLYPRLEYDTTVATNTVAGLTAAANADAYRSLTLTAAPTGFSISLGAFGGSISYAYDHSIPNTDGADLKIAGNAFAGNSEPGAVFVSQDVNGNGIADDP